MVWGEARVPVSMDQTQELLRSCYHLHMGKKNTFNVEMDDGAAIFGAYVGEDLRHQAYRRIG